MSTDIQSTTNPGCFTPLVKGFVPAFLPELFLYPCNPGHLRLNESVVLRNRG